MANGGEDAGHSREGVADAEAVVDGEGGVEDIEEVVDIGIE